MTKSCNVFEPLCIFVLQSCSRCCGCRVHSPGAQRRKTTTRVCTDSGGGAGLGIWTRAQQGRLVSASRCLGAPWGLEPSPVSSTRYSAIGWCRLLVAASVLARNASLYVVSLRIGWSGLPQSMVAGFHGGERGREREKRGREKDEKEKRGGEEQGAPGRNDILFMISPWGSCSIVSTILCWLRKPPAPAEVQGRGN